MAKELKKITQEELDTILKSHELWVNSNGKEGERANLSYTDLMINGDLLRLKNRNLQEINLQGSKLHCASLTNVNLTKANLQNTDFSLSTIRGSNLQNVNLKNVNFFDAYLDNSLFQGATITDSDFRSSRLSGSQFQGVNFSRVNLYGADFSQANFHNANLDYAFFREEELEKAQNVNLKYLPIKDIILNSESQIQSAKEKIKELEKTTNASQEEKEKLEEQINELKEKVTSFERTKAEEKKAQEKTTSQIEAAVGFLKNPNEYITTQINIQYLLVAIYVLFTVFAVIVFKDNIVNNYHVFKDLIKGKPTFITWLFYASPTILSFSLTIIFINQINARLQNIVRLNERKRYVDSVEGGLQAINALSINNEDARKKILDTMDKIIDHTLKSSEKANEPISLDEKTVEDPLTTLSKIKGLLK